MEGSIMRLGEIEGLLPKFNGNVLIPAYILREPESELKEIAQHNYTVGFTNAVNIMLLTLANTEIYLDVEGVAEIIREEFLQVEGKKWNFNIATAIARELPRLLKRRER